MKQIKLTLVPGASIQVKTIDNENTEVITIPAGPDIATFNFTVSQLVTNYGGIREYDLFASALSSIEEIEFTSPDLTDVIANTSIPLGLGMHPDIALDSAALTYILNFT